MGVFCVQPVYALGGCYGAESSTQTIGLALASVSATAAVLLALALVQLLGGRRASSCFELLLPLVGLTSLLGAALDVLVKHSTGDGLSQAALFSRLAAASDIISIGLLLAYAVVVARKLLSAVTPAAVTLLLSALLTASVVTTVLLAAVNEASVLYRRRQNAITATFATNATALQFISITTAILGLWIGILGFLLLLCVLVVVKEPGELGDLALLSGSLVPLLVEAGLAFLPAVTDASLIARRALIMVSLLGLCLGAVLRNRKQGPWAELADDEKESPKRPSPARLSSMQTIGGPKFTVSTFGMTQEPPPKESFDPGPPPLRRSDSSAGTSIPFLLDGFPRPPASATQDFPRPVTMLGPRGGGGSNFSSLQPPPRDRSSLFPRPPAAITRGEDVRDSVQSAVTDVSVDMAVVRQASVAKRTPSQRVAVATARSPSARRASRPPSARTADSSAEAQPVRPGTRGQDSDESLPDPVLHSPQTPRGSAVGAALTPRTPATGKSDETWQGPADAAESPIPPYRLPYD